MFTIRYYKSIHNFKIIIIILGFISCDESTVYNISNRDHIYKKGIQTILGKLQCEYYNLGGEGVAYHDTDSINSGSGNLNIDKDYLSTFRINEGVDIYLQNITIVSTILNITWSNWHHWNYMKIEEA